MGRMLGDVLVRDERRLRPSKASVYLTSGEIPPEDYPEHAIRAVRSECLRAYREKRSPWWRVDGSKTKQSVVAAIAKSLAQIVLFVSESPPPSPSPPPVAVARALG